jgi:hypothetical protein
MATVINFEATFGKSKVVETVLLEIKHKNK